MTPQELDKLAKVCRKHGITAFSADGISITFDSAFQPIAPTVQTVSAPAPAPLDKPMSEEDILFFSAGN